MSEDLRAHVRKLHEILYSSRNSDGTKNKKKEKGGKGALNSCPIKRGWKLRGGGRGADLGRSFRSFFDAPPWRYEARTSLGTRPLRLVFQGTSCTALSAVNNVWHARRQCACQYLHSRFTCFDRTGLALSWPVFECKRPISFLFSRPFEISMVVVIVQSWNLIIIFFNDQAFIDWILRISLRSKFVNNIKKNKSK